MRKPWKELDISVYDVYGFFDIELLYFEMVLKFIKIEVDGGIGVIVFAIFWVISMNFIGSSNPQFLFSEMLIK